MPSLSAASLTAVLGPTNTGKTHLAVERMAAHSSGMMGFPLRLLAREIYDRLAAIKGPAQVALITGEERIEPANARYYCCTVESMPIDGDFAFVGVDEAQLGTDPERGHIFTDRMLHARGREETMILGSESLRPVISLLLPEAEIITRPRFSTLSYAGAKKLSRLPKRSAIVAFSVEQVYAVAELLRRQRGGCAVVMGALSPRTRNAQVEMFQSGEVDYIVATDAIGMGLNLDLHHVAFAALSKFDGKRRRRLSVQEMAQIAGRAGRHHRDGSFGELAGEGFAFTPEEIEAIEEHRFAPLDWLYWREAEPDCSSIDALIAGLSQRPREEGLRAAPEALDLEILRRLAEMPAAMQLAEGEAKVRRLWDTARLPDFRGVGVEPHSRFVASLWQHLGQGDQHIPQSMVAQELARLDNVQGDVDSISGRIAAVRSWTYIAHRADWLAKPTAMAVRARDLEAKLSDALHAALRQRFVDQRTVKLMRGAAADAALLPVEITVDRQVMVDGEHIGALEGFAFTVDAAARAGDRKLLLAAAQRHLAGYLREKAGKVAMAEDTEFALVTDAAGRPAIEWNGERLGQLTKGRSLLQPAFAPERAVGEVEGDALRAVTQRAEAWIAAALEKHMEGIVALDRLAQDPATEAPVRALAMQLAEAGGIAGRKYLTEAIRALPQEARGAARKGGIVFGALDIFHHQAMKPAAVKWRMALFAARDGRPVADLPPESAVHLASWNFSHPAEARNAGYRRIGDEYIRIDLAERVIKKAHEARGDTTIFGMNLDFATSLGVSEKGLTALMRDAGFRKAEAPDPADGQAAQKVDAAEVPVPDSEAESTAVASPQAVEADNSGLEFAGEERVTSADGPLQATEQDGNAQEVIGEAAEEPAGQAAESNASQHATKPALSWWRWVGLGKTRPRHTSPHAKSAGKRHSGKSKGARGADSGGRKAQGGQVKPPSALALQLAALTGKAKPESE